MKNENGVIAIYSRKSKFTGKGESIGNQVDLCREYIRLHYGDAEAEKAIVFEDEVPMLCGTPWSGKTSLNVNRKVPLKAIVFIERGQQNSIRRLDTLDSYFNLSSQIARPYYDAGVGEKMIEFAERLLATVPIYGLSCNISTEAVDTVVNEIFPEEDK